MKAIILAGGQSSRFKPMPDKTTIEVVGKPLIIHRIESLKNAGFDKVDVVASPHNFYEIQDAISFYNHKASQVFLQSNPHNNGGAVTSIPDNVLNEPTMFVCANDTVEDSLLHQLNHSIKQKNPEALFVGQQRDTYFDGGYLKIDSQNRLQEIVEKPGDGNQPSNLINIVYQYFKNPLDFKRTIELKIQQDLATKSSYQDAISSMINNGLDILVHSYTGKWTPIKHPFHLLTTSQMIIEMLSQNNQPIIHPSSIIESGAVIYGKSYIGPDVIVKSDSVIVDSHISDMCVITNSIIANSYFSSGSQSHNCSLNNVLTSGDFKILNSNLYGRSKDPIVVTKHQI